MPLDNSSLPDTAPPTASGTGPAGTLARERIAVSAFPDEAWIKTCRALGKQFCQSLDFPEPLVDRAGGTIAAACAEIERLCRDSEPTEPVSFRLGFNDGAVVLEFDYPDTLPLDPRSAGVEAAAKASPPNLRVTVDDLWIERVKALMDRVAFREEGNRRVIETRLYYRTEGQLGRFWLMGLCSKLKPDVVIHQGDGGACLLQDESTGRTLYLDSGAAFVARRLDSAHTFHQIYMDYVDEVALIAPEHLALIFESLEGHGLLVSDEVRPERETRLARWVEAIDHRLRRNITLPGGEELVEAAYRRLSFIFKPPILIGIGLFALSGFYPLFAEIDHPHEMLSKPFHAIRTDLSLLIELYVFLLIVGVMHEMAHALTCRHFGGRVRRLGIRAYLGLVVFFADTSSVWVFREKWKRVAVAMAGPAVNLTVMSACFWIWDFSKDGGAPEYSIWFVGGFFCIYTTLMNLIPLIKMDGYYALADLLEMPALREKSFAHVSQRLSSLIGRNPKVEGARPTATEGIIYWVYGLLGGLFAALVFAVVLVSVVHNVASHEVPAAITFLSLLFLSITLYSLTYRLYRSYHASRHWRVVIE